MRVFKDARNLSSSVVLGAVLASVRSIVVLRLLGPTLIGAWKTALLVDSLGEIARSGVLRGMSIRLPMLAGEGDTEEADRTGAAAGGFLFWLGLAIGAAILGASFLVPNANVRLSLRFLAFSVGLTQPYYYLRELAGARHSFGIRYREELLRTILDFILAVVLCKLFGLAGLGLATCLALATGTMYYLKRQQAPFRFALDRNKLLDLMRTGVPFSITEAGYDLLRRIDVWVIALMIGSTAVGYYGLSILIMDFGILLSQRALAQVLSPLLLKEFGRTKSHAEVAVFYEFPARFFCYVLPPILGIGTFLIGIFTRALLPQFSAGVPAAEVTLWTIFFVALHFSISPFFAATKLIPKIIKLMAGMIVIAVIAQAAVLNLGWGIEGAAWCTLATSAVWAAVELYVARTTRGEAHGAAGFIASLYLPLMVCIALRALVQTIPVEPLVRMTLFLLLYLPVFAGYEMRFSMLRTVRKALYTT
jgi:O-antigen/teichoic acid export membrane protein